MAMTLDELRQQLTMDTYTPKTDEQMREEANKQYASVYGQKKLAAQQTFDQTDLALSNQLASLDQSYAKQREAAAKATRASQSSLDRYSLQRGMQRSSFNAASQSNILAEGEKTLADINQSETVARQNIESQRAQLASQLAAQLGQYDVDYANDVQAYFNQLRQQDEASRVEADKYRNQLLMALYEYDQKGGSSGGGGGSRGGSYASASSSSAMGYGDAQTEDSGNAYDQFLEKFGSSGNRARQNRAANKLGTLKSASMSKLKRPAQTTSSAKSATVSKVKNVARYQQRISKGGTIR